MINMPRVFSAILLFHWFLSDLLFNYLLCLIAHAKIRIYTMRDIDDYLEENDHDVSLRYPNNTHDAVHDSFDLNPLDLYHSYNNNLAFDMFSNDNHNSGQGSLPLLDSDEQQRSFASSGLDGHISSPNSQQGHEQHQLAMASSLNSNPLHYTTQHDQDPFAESIEHDITAPEEEDDEDQIPLKNEEPDEETKEEKDGQRKRGKRKPYNGPRSLIRWHTGQDQLALMALIYELEMDNVTIPQALPQHLTKARKARIYYGLPVPPLVPSKRKTDSDKLGNVTEKDVKVWSTLTYTKPGRDNQADGAPGTMRPYYTPLPVAGRPDLPHFDPTTGTEVNMSREPPETPAKAPRASKPASAASKKKSKQTVKEDADREESAPIASSEKKGRSHKKVVKVEQDDDAAYSEKPTRKAQNTPAASKRKPAAKPATSVTPSKPKGVTKSKKTPSTLNKKMSAMAFKSPEANIVQAATPSKKPRAPRKKAMVNATPVLGNLTAPKTVSAAINKTEKSGQSYGRVGMKAPSMPVQSLENMLADLPQDQFQMGKHQASQSFDSQSTMSTVPSQSMLDTSAQFNPNNFHLQMQNNYPVHSYPSNSYGNHMMPSHNSSFAHGHGVSAMASGAKQQQSWDLGMQGQGGYPMQQYNSGPGHGYGNVNNHGSPYGLGIMNSTALLPREHIQLENELGNYSFDNGPASNMLPQQQLYSDDSAQMQTDGNDMKPNMEQYADFADNSNFGDGSNIYTDYKQTTSHH
ncbi:hypothetical protein KCU95_g14764, partial [Aureobasidium melanogenum]